MGEGLPRFNSIAGGFKGGVRTRYQSSFPPRLPRVPTYDSNLDMESEDEYENQHPSYSHNNYHYRPSPRPYHNGNVKFTQEFSSKIILNKQKT